MTTRRTRTSLTALLIASLVILAGCAGVGGACRDGSCQAGGACRDGRCQAGGGHGKGMGGGMHANEPRLNTPTLALLLDAGVPVTLLDARTGKYDDGRRIPGAKALAPTATAEEAAKAIPAKDALVVTYCANPQCPAEAKLAKQLRSLGYTRVIEYPYGIDGWTSSGHGAEQAPPR